ncbi:IclR family transcriptional regulator [Defluviimonas aestuarii]|uniref:IclR family transcriptional regulator n=1 Tax=Albidovulum aestuarii TaxID=1130726 RepID=UPI00249AED8A|nr:IclR family transcriptional regulator [Defluviimonas aestuarii]MDI3337704.1 IclR family transcriptional regulator [Defluviimonas aestuarii]
MTEQKNTRNSPRRVLEIIEAICLNPEAATATRLSQSLGIPAPTIYRWLDTLCEERFIVAHTSGHYMPGERFRNLVLNSLQYEPKVTERRSLMRKLSEVLSETVSLSIPHGTKLIYFDRLESHWPFQVNLKVGAPLPLHCCASGKLYLSSLEPDVASGIFDRIAEKGSARGTITDQATFGEELARIRKDGFALDREEWFDDMVGAAVPIYADSGALVACLSTHALTTRKTIGDLEKDIPVMIDIAGKLKACMLG